MDDYGCVMELTPDLADMLERAGIATPEQAAKLREEIAAYLPNEGERAWVEAVGRYREKMSK